MADASNISTVLRIKVRPVVDCVGSLSFAVFRGNNGKMWPKCTGLETRGRYFGYQAMQRLENDVKHNSENSIRRDVPCLCSSVLICLLSQVGINPALQIKRRCPSERMRQIAHPRLYYFPFSSLFLQFLANSSICDYQNVTSQL